LGLATVQEIVRDHDGAMNVQSKSGLGSRFEAWLPAAATDDIDLDVTAALPLGRGETVLVIESERERLLRDEEMLAALGYEPVGFWLPDDAIAACRSTPERFDAVIIDNVSPAAKSFELARTMHAILAKRPILVATTPTTNVDTLADAGISEVLRRPLVSTEVAVALARCLRAQRHSPQTLRS
jgi:DNA-binding NtrC family response regulator